MKPNDKSAPTSPILAAIQAKRERRHGTTEEIAELEASLLADIEAFDLDAAERRAMREYLARPTGSMVDATLAFPEVAPSRTKGPTDTSAPVPDLPDLPPLAPEAPAGSLLDQLRHQAATRQREMHTALAQRTQVNEAIDQALKRTFFYLHELVQQLNIVKPDISRHLPLTEDQTLDQLSWQEGFSDYRTQSQSAGALVELVTFTYHLSGERNLHVSRDGPAVERFRTTLFDFGLPFTCKEFKNDRRYVERAEFDIRSDVSVSVRWKADFARGAIVVEARNLERLGSALFTLAPQAIDQALLDEFGRLVLAQPNRFRELIKRK